MGSIRAFFEYKIDEANRSAYLEWAAKFRRWMHSAGLSDFQVLESNDRRNQFLETFTIGSMEEYEYQTKELLAQPEYQELEKQRHGWVAGGHNSMKIWFFHEI